MQKQMRISKTLSKIEIDGLTPINDLCKGLVISLEFLTQTKISRKQYYEDVGHIDGYILIN